MTTETTEASEFSEITVSREIAAPPGRVYALWLDEAAMLKWFGIEGITNLSCRTDPREGGAWRLEAEGPNGPFAIEGIYRALEPDRRILQSWQHIDAEGRPGNETEAEILIEETPRGCRVTVHHRRIKYTPDAFREGWGQSLARLAGLAEPA